PNPANPSTTIQFTLAKPGNVSLDIYSISGQRVATLVDGAMTAGTHSAVFDGSSLASGIYLYRFRTAGFAKTGKIALVK
ncbi:MAG: T9SS type A sorting domain-containing protein, partial [Syntrophorhabdus aromaticivorans]|nr:T9SS type A sorting domain-containing protein [Syntrophorhabdus aromaticivorans]